MKRILISGVAFIIVSIVTVSSAEADLSVVRYYHVSFSFDSPELEEKSKQDLHVFAECMILILEIKPKITFQVIGYTDVRGSKEYNMKLSLARARAVKTYLSNQFSRIPEDRIVIMGRGESEPIAMGNTEEDHLLNRRVELRISISHKILGQACHNFEKFQDREKAGHIFVSPEMKELYLKKLERKN